MSKPIPTKNFETIDQIIIMVFGYLRGERTERRTNSLKSV